MNARFYRDLLLDEELLEERSLFVQEEIKAQKGESCLGPRGIPYYSTEDQSSKR